MSRVKDPRILILGVSPKVQSKDLPGSKLPTGRQILISYNARKDLYINSKKMRFACARELVEEQIIPLYERARVPLRSKDNCAMDIIKLNDEMYKLMKNPKKQRTSKTSKNKINKFKTKLDKTMKLWPKDALKMMVQKEDKDFLLNMMGDRTAVMVGVDSKLAQTEKKVAERKIAELKRKHSEEERVKKSKVLVDDCQSEEQETEPVDDDFEGDNVLNETKRKHRRTVKTGEKIFIPHDILKNPMVVAAAVRNKIKPTGLAQITNAIINSCGGDTEKFNLAYTQSYRLVVDFLHAFKKYRNKIYNQSSTPLILNYFLKIYLIVVRKYKVFYLSSLSDKKTTS